MKIHEEVIQLQKKFHDLPGEDYDNNTEAYRSLMKEYNTLNRKLKKQGYSEQEITDMYIEAERSFEEDKSDGEACLVLNFDTLNDIAENL